MRALRSLPAVRGTRGVADVVNPCRALGEPCPERMPQDPVARERILAVHDAALSAGEPGYRDPFTGLFVMTAQYLVDRGTCCGNGCRHCPYC